MDINSMLVGFSWSFCIKDILKGKVQLDQVIAIISGTRMQNQADFMHVIESYSKSYWKGYPMDKILEIAYELAPKLWQSRIYGIDPIYTIGIEWVRFDKFSEYLKCRRMHLVDDHNIHLVPSQSYWL